MKSSPNGKPYQAAAFARLLLFLLAAPWLAHKTFLPNTKTFE
jgi:hypothetical protein